jgi:tripartite-type tricarboxylate transporter receptor subunit TctC
MHRRALLPLFAAPLAARAQGYPMRVVRIVVPYPGGGGLDALGRAVAEQLGSRWGQPVIIDNRPGAATITGADFVARSAPDGHTLLLTSDSTITSNPHLYRSLPSDPMRDLVPVSYLLDVHQMVLVHPSVAATDMASLIAAARAAPGRLNYASYGPGSQPHLLFEALKAQTGIELTHVAYRGLAPAVLATISGEVQATLSGIASARQHLAAGTLRALAVGKPTRFEQLPQVPTLAEAAFADIDPRTWFGVFAPSGTPVPLLGWLRDEIAWALAVPAVAERHLAPNGYTMHAATPADSARLIAADFVYKAELIRRSGARVE